MLNLNPRNFKNIPISRLDEYMDWEIEQRLGNTTVAVADRSVAWMYRGVTLRAHGVASMPFVIESKNGAEVDSSEDYQNAVGFLPNPKRLFELMEQSRTLTGSYYLLHLYNRITTKELRYLVPTSIKPIITSAGVQYFERRTQEGTIRLSVDDVIYDWLPDANVELGPPKRFPAAAALSAAGIELNLDRFVEAFFKRGAIKATLLTMKGNPPQQEKDRLKELWTKITSGIGNAFGTTVWNAEAIETTVVGEGVKELENQQLSEEQRHKIAGALMIPQTKLFSGDAAGIGGGGVVSQDDLNFLNECLVPECDAIAAVLNERVFAPLGYRLRWQYENLDAFQEDENARAQSLSAFVGVLNQCTMLEEFEAATMIMGYDVPDDAMAKIVVYFGEKDKRRVEMEAQQQEQFSAQLESRGNGNKPLPANMDVSKPKPKELPAQAGKGIALESVQGTAGASPFFVIDRTDDVVVSLPKETERAQYKRWAAKRLKDGKALDGFVFEHLDVAEQAELTGGRAADDTVAAFFRRHNEIRTSGGTPVLRAAT